MDTKRNLFLDFIKGIAIIAVALYHFGGGILPYGYLGVDIFLVVGGYLLVKQLDRQFENKEFHYFRFLFRKAVRLWPLVISAVIISMIAGSFLMLPNDYENLAESAVASSVFANNILQCITTKNYWDVINQYKPLMHLWYVGLLMQAYIVLPLLYFVSSKIARSARKGLLYTTIGITGLSLILFLLPMFSTAWKFYYLPFRLFEITAGGLIALLPIKKSDIRLKAAGMIVSFVILIVMLCFRWGSGSSSLMLIITTAATLLFIQCSKETEAKGWISKVISAFAAVGKRSYSIYIWHQVIIAFLFYSVFEKQNVVSFLVFAALTAAVSAASYRFIEVPLGKALKNKKAERIIVIVSAAFAVVISSVSFLIYLKAGVIRDVPELDITKSSTHRGMHSEYCDRVYSWNVPFKEESETKILVIGNSFGRDWANILREYNEEFDVSFLYYSESALLGNKDRINEADYVFYALGLSYGEVPTAVKENVSADKLYIISNKNYGESNGIIYAHRNSDGYYSQTVDYNEALKEDVEHNKEIWSDHYIDLMAPVVTDDGKIRVFTDDDKYISQDCRHLTQAGAQYYAGILQLDKLFEKQK